MARLVRCGLIQTHCEWSPEKYSITDISKKMLDKTEKLIEAAAKKEDSNSLSPGAFQRAVLLRRAANPIARAHRTDSRRDCPTTGRMKKLGQEHRDGDCCSNLEREMTGFFFNTAAVIDAEENI